MKDILEKLDDRRAQARLGGGQVRIDAQHARAVVVLHLHEGGGRL